ncbi:MAG TPA: peptidoglycan-associated lipoprotein Pal [Casimicrobiaceae bacterium]|nr:peptidoglycan-associated lipoprotein Pal [Casimicrobiaceae bacterium]
MNKSFFAALIVLGLVACQSTPPKEEGAPVEDRTPATGAAGATTAGTTGSGVTGTAMGAGQSALRDPSSILSKRIIYFDFDSYVVKDEFKPLIEAHARYLQANRNARMTIQGNADERGSREYNIALGQRRADAVKKMMLIFGAGEVQIETVSFGKEKPRVDGHDEAAWAQNRRDEIVYASDF